jgi:hypothetical protein
MSAPWEMFFNPVKFVGGISLPIRYLRANLTCGECARHKTMWCAHPWHSPGREIPDNTEACMAFEPKEPKP